MAGTIIGNGDITFGDSTVKTTANFPWTNLTSRPTLLSQFTNDLGNYGGFFTSANAYNGYTLSDPYGVISICGSNRGSNGHRTSGQWNLTWSGSGTVGLRVTNCNCACNC